MTLHPVIGGENSENNGAECRVPGFLDGDDTCNGDNNLQMNRQVKSVTYPQAHYNLSCTKHGIYMPNYGWEP